MSRLRLYSYWRSSASHRVRIALQLKGLEYDYVPVHLAAAGGGEQYSAAYRALNPQSRVPALETGEGVLTQSMAILEWLEETHPEPPLLPRAPAARAQVRAMAQIMVADVQPLQNTSVGRYLQEQCHLDEAAVDAWRRHWVARGLTVLEDMLARGGPPGDYCHGPTPTLADVCLLPQCASARRFGLDPAAWPRIARIEKACNANAAFQRAAPANQPDAVR
ncbi:MAG TPA: maleylacetoacetate isomerase [Steroidobacteraceae bacterium]|nr:maleylacetoacetate isomerase [Steroidobacteraceae bacterium]